MARSGRQVRPTETKRRRTGRYIIIGCAAVIMAAVALAVVPEKPPLDRIGQAHDAVAKARRAEAPCYAPVQWHLADSFHTEIMTRWDVQNRRFFLVRDFDTIAALASQTVQIASAAESLAAHTRKSLSAVTEIKIGEVRRMLAEFRSRYDNIPMPSAIRRKASAGEMLLVESKSAFERGDVKKAFEKCRKAEDMIGNADRHVSDKMEDYLSNVPRWRIWANTAIATSRKNGSNAIVVDKMAHTCRLYGAGRLRYEFTAELGKNWMGHKTSKGDNATPEGNYLVTVKKTQSKYFRALVINYPNKEDRSAFADAKNHGKIAPDASLGGLIEIHGSGGKGVDWTEGCIALRNEDMTKLFNAVQTGTPVTIVGALSAAGEHQ